MYCLSVVQQNLNEYKFFFEELDSLSGTGRVEDIGMSKGRHYTINVPLKDGIQDDNFYRIFEQ